MEVPAQAVLYEVPFLEFHLLWRDELSRGRGLAGTQALGQLGKALPGR